MRLFNITALATVLTLATALPTAPAAAPTPPAAPTSSTPQNPELQTLLQRLNSPNPAERQAAQSQLTTLVDMLRQPELVQKLIDTTPDPDLKAFLQTRLDQIHAKEEEKRIANLPPISLSVKDATLAQVVEALNQALDTSNKLEYILAGRANNPALSPYSLDVKDKPFWEVFTTLQKQSPFTLANSPTTGLRITPGPVTRGGLAPPAPRPFVIDGPAIAFFNSISLQRNLNLQAADTSVSQSNLTLAVNVLTDPRLHVTRIKYPTITDAQDNQGHHLQSTTTFPGNGFSTPTINRSITFNNPPAALGTSISFTYESALEIATATSVTTIDDLQNNLNKPVTAGDRTIRVTNFTAANTGTLAISTTSTPTAGNQPSPPTFTLLDSTGKTVRTISSAGSMSLSFPTANFTPPYKLEVRVATKTVLLPVRFQFKDIPLP